MKLIDQETLEIKLRGKRDAYDSVIVHVGKRKVTIYGDGTFTVEIEGDGNSYIDTTVKRLHKALLKAEKEDEPPSVVVTDPWVKNILSAAGR